MASSITEVHSHDEGIGRKKCNQSSPECKGGTEQTCN